MDQKTRLEEITNRLYFTGTTPPEPEPVHSQWAQVALKYKATLPTEQLPDLTKTSYRSKPGCYYAIATAFSDTYNLHRQAFALDSEGSLITKVADYYTDAVHRYFSNLSSFINQHCRAVGKMEECRLIARLIIDTREYLLEEYRRELLEHPNLYMLPPLSRYVKKVVLYKNPVVNPRHSQNPFSRLCVPACYHILSVTPGWKALRADTETLYQHFIDKAHKVYAIYLFGILTSVNALGVPAPSEGNGDALWDYVSKLSVLRDVQQKMFQIKNKHENKEDSQ